MTIPNRRIALGAAGAALLCAAMLPAALAQAWPSKPLRIIVPFAPGGVTDMVSRTMAQGLSSELGQPVIVENQAGASGIPGAEFAAKALYPFVQEGKVRALAITSAKRSPLAPELPTLTELGLPKVEVTSWQAIVVPAGVPPAVSARLVEAVHRVLAKPAIQAQLAKQGVEAVSSTPQELANYADAEMKRWKGVAHAAGVKPE